MDPLPVTQSIRSLAPRVSQAQAIEAFTGGAWRALTGDRLRNVAATYLPFRFYEVDVTNAGKRTTSIFAADAVNGSLDLYEFERLPADAEVVSVESANAPLPQVDEARALFEDWLLGRLDYSAADTRTLAALAPTAQSPADG